MIITFTGHATLSLRGEEIAEMLKATISENLPSGEKVTFFCGGYGEFDMLCAKVCHAMKHYLPHLEVILVTPYITESHQKKLNDDPWVKEMYDGIVYPPLETVPLRYAISRRNEWMMEHADLIITFVTHRFGGAYKTLTYAKQKKKKIINLAGEDLP